MPSVSQPAASRCITDIPASASFQYGVLRRPHRSSLTSKPPYGSMGIVSNYAVPSNPNTPTSRYAPATRLSDVERGSVTGLEHFPTAGQVGSFVTAVSTMRLPAGNVRPLLHATSVSKVTFQYAKAIHLPGIRGCYTRISKQCRRASRLQLGRYSGFDEPHPANYMIP